MPTHRAAAQQAQEFREPDAQRPRGAPRLAGVGEPFEDRSEGLYNEHRERIERLCRLILGDPDLAEEVGQDVFLKLHIAVDVHTDTIDWARWLTRVAVNACRDVRRGRWWRDRLAGRHPVDFESVAGVEPDPEAAVGALRRRLAIHAAFSRLSARQREVFALRHFEGWSTEQTAELLGMSTGSVKKHLFRAVARMRTALGGER